MDRYSRSHVADHDLLENVAKRVARTNADMAELLAEFAEIDSRRLYLELASPSMFAYCLRRLHLDEHSAYKRIHAARAARKHRAIFPAVADGRLHLTAVLLLKPFLTPENADDLIAAATHKSKAQIERMLAERFPRPTPPSFVRPLPVPATPNGLVWCSPAQPALAGVPAPERVESRDRNLAPAPEQVGLHGALVPARAPEQVESPAAAMAAPAPEQVPASGPRPRVTPLSADAYLLQVTMPRAMHERLEYAKALLGHRVPPGAIAEILDRGLIVLIEKLEKSKFAATSKPHASRPAKNKRTIPANVQRAVWQRDGGQCTFESESGQRCTARSNLQYDHIEPVARGGQATVANIRLRCAGHNQVEADRVFGAGFMDRKRQEARDIAAQNDRPPVRAQSTAAVMLDPEHDVTPWLQRLGFRSEEVRRAAAYCAKLEQTRLEDRVRAAIAFLRP